MGDVWSGFIGAIIGGLISGAATYWANINSTKQNSDLQEVREKRNNKLWVFSILMRTRVSGLDKSHVEALNSVDVAFCDNNRKDKDVIEAWKIYIKKL